MWTTHQSDRINVHVENANPQGFFSRLEFTGFLTAINPGYPRGPGIDVNKYINDKNLVTCEKSVTPLFFIE